MKTVLLAGGIPVLIKKSRRRSLALAIRPGGQVELRLPYFVTYKKGLAFLEKKLVWIAQKQKEWATVAPSFLQGGSRQEFERLKLEATTLIRDRVAELGAFYNLYPKKIRIRHITSRWGSCSAEGMLSFSYRLLLLPEHLRDYVIVHELCHLKEFNHSQKFWGHVAIKFPLYRELRRELKMYKEE